MAEFTVMKFYHHMIYGSKEQDTFKILQLCLYDAFCVFAYNLENKWLIFELEKVFWVKCFYEQEKIMVLFYAYFRHNSEFKLINNEWKMSAKVYLMHAKNLPPKANASISNQHSRSWETHKTVKELKVSLTVH